MFRKKWYLSVSKRFIYTGHIFTVSYVRDIKKATKRVILVNVTHSTVHAFLVNFSVTKQNRK